LQAVEAADEPVEHVAQGGGMSVAVLAAAAGTFMLERSMTPDAVREMASKSALARH